jgi:hypothetical protein
MTMMKMMMMLFEVTHSCTWIEIFSNDLGTRNYMA